MFTELEEAIFKYVRMWRKKATLEELERLTHIPHATLHLWELGRRGPKVKYVDRIAKSLKCPVVVIIGLQPCTAKCPHCRIAQP